MCISQFDLIKYGKFIDEMLCFLLVSEDFYVIVGLNEVGKLMICMVVFELLFGMKLQMLFDFLYSIFEL